MGRMPRFLLVPAPAGKFPPPTRPDGGGGTPPHVRLCGGPGGGGGGDTPPLVQLPRILESHPVETPAALSRRIIACTRCPRLRAYGARVAREKKRAFRDEVYWGRPVPGWGDPRARLLVVGLAPAAHGANRTGRMFTGDSSGDWLYAALHRFGFASRSRAPGRDDGLTLTDCWITAAARCAPPGNTPAPTELDRCRPYLEAELRLLPSVRLVIALGRIAHD